MHHHSCYLGSHGQLDFEPSTIVSSLCRPNEVIVATVPTPPNDRNAISSTLASPIHSHLNSLFQSHTNAITADLFQCFDEVVESAKKEREELKVALRVEREELKAALKVEREKREELRAALRAEREKREELKTALTVERERREAALKVEREKREELKTALKVERERREEALKVEREKWEKALKVEREERESEKADASKRYEHLRNHLLEVEETTLDTVGWLANDVSHLLSGNIRIDGERRIGYENARQDQAAPPPEQRSGDACGCGRIDEQLFRSVFGLERGSGIFGRPVHQVGRSTRAVRSSWCQPRSAHPGISFLA